MARTIRSGGAAQIVTYPLTPLDESQRQITLLALHKLKADRPGWDDVIGKIETAFGGQLPFPPSRPRLVKNCGHRGLKFNCKECRIILGDMGLV